MTTTPDVEVRLTLTVDLTSQYTNPGALYSALREQTERISDCHTVIVQIGPDAARYGVELGDRIARVFYLTAQRIEIHAPAGGGMGPLIHAEAERCVRLYRADHERMLATVHAAE